MLVYGCTDCSINSNGIMRNASDIHTIEIVLTFHPFFLPSSTSTSPTAISISSSSIQCTHTQQQQQQQHTSTTPPATQYHRLYSTADNMDVDQMLTQQHPQSLSPFTFQFTTSSLSEFTSSSTTTTTTTATATAASSACTGSTSNSTSSSVH